MYREIKNRLSTFSISDKFLVVLIFLSIFIAYFYWGYTPVTDSRWSIPTAMSIIKEGNTDLDEYEHLLEINDYYMIERHDGHYYNYYPVGTSLLSLPIVFIVNATSDQLLTFQLPGTSVSIELNNAIGQAVPMGIELFVASIFISLTSVLIFLIGRKSLDKKYSLLLVFIFAFCTAAWSTGSRSLLQHGPSMLLLTIALYLLLQAKDRPRLAQFASLPLAYSYIIRPTNILPALLLTVYVVIQYREYLLRFILWALVVVVPFITFNLYVFGSLLPTYYKAGSHDFGPENILVALSGNLISPARGLFIWTPIFLISIYGIYLKVKRKSFERLDYFLVAIIFLHWFTISLLPKVWWSGHSVGNRFYSDMAPLFVYYLIPLFIFIPTLKGWYKYSLMSVIGILIIFSFFIQYQGATNEDVFKWNSKPTNVDSNPARLWDWGDIQFFRGL